MKKPILAALALCYALGAAAQTPDTAAPEGYRFTDVKILPVTPVKDQSRSGTCWCYSTLSFLESEILRAGGPELDLSEMWIVRNIYFEKAVKYVRLHGSLNLAVGGQAHDVLHGIEAYGIVPEEVYPGLNYGYDKPNFDEIDAVIKAYADAVIKAGGKRSDRRLTTWFICFVTRNGKTYAAAIMIEEGRSGGKSCAPLAAEFFSRYFQPAPEPPEKRANPAE